MVQTSADIFLKILGIVMVLTAWSFVVFPTIPVAWKGGNRAPLSRPSRVVMAIASTGWCLAVFRVYPAASAILFAGCVGYGFVLSNRDRAAYDAARGEVGPIPRPLSPRQRWLALCMLDASVMSLMLYVFVRDLKFPPVTRDQRDAHILGMFFLVASLLGALVLYFKRPRGTTRNAL